MENFETIVNNECELPQQQTLPSENNSQLAENALQTNDNTDALQIIDNTSNSEHQTPVETTNVSSTDTNVASETNSVVSSDNSMPPLPPLPTDDKGQLSQPPAAYSADYNMQNYANYNYMYNYNNYYGYPYPQYQWDYNSQQYYQPYQNYYNYNYNANQTQTSKPPPPPPDSVQLPVEEKPANKSNITTVDDSNRYSPTAETDDDDTMKGLSENNKSDVHNEQPPAQTTKSLTNSVPMQIVPTEQTEFQKNITESESVDHKMLKPIFPSVTSEQQSIVPLIAQIQYNIPVQQPTYSINPQIQIQSTEANSELINQQQNPTLNGKDDSAEKVTKGSTVLGKTQAKKRLMAFSMMKQKLQEQNNLNNENPSSDIGEANDVEFVPELNVFQTVTKKKVVTNKKVAKVIKAQQTIEQIEEMKKDELLQGNNAALYQHLLRSGGNEAPILQKLGIESLAEKYSAKIREQDKRMKRHHHRRRDDNRRSHKYRRRSHSKSRSRSRSRSAEKPKMRALEVKSWKDFVTGGFHFDRFRRFKLDEAEELKEKERKSRSKKRHSDSRSDGKNQNTDSGISTEVEKNNADQKLRYNILDHKKEIRKGLEVLTHEADFTKDFPSYIIQYTKTKPVIKYSENPATATCHFQNRQQMLATLLPEIEIIVHKFLSEMKPKKLKENTTDDNYTYIDDKILIMMKDKNIYPFKGWWPKTYFIMTQVKENPNIEIDKDALINQFTMSKRTKKSRFNDDTSLVDIRPTVPSKWDSDYDGSPATEKVVDIDISQNVEMNANDNVRLSSITNTEEANPPDISHQEDAMDTASDIGENEPKIEINIGPILSIPSHEPQGHAKLDTEYEEFLKIVSAEKNDEKIENNLLTSTVEKEHENNQSVKSVSLNDESIEIDQDYDSEDSSSSDESVSLHNIVDESMDKSFVKKLKKKKKSSNKKSKKYKKKEGKKKKRKSSSSESSQVSESESDSSSEESESESTDSTSSIEKKKKKKSKDKKKKKNKANFKKKYKGDKIKVKNVEDGIDNNSSILNLLEKAFNVEIKKRPLDHEEPKQKKKKRKHDKKENKSNGGNEDKFEKVKECLKETFTKLVKTDIVGKNQSLSCDDSTVNEVLKYLKIDEEKEKKNKKSKKNSKRKYDSDISDDEKFTKKFKLDDGSKYSDSERKKKSKKKKSSKKFNDSDEQILKKKSKKKSRTSDSSETEDGEGSKHKKSKNEKGTEHFFGLRPNEWNINNQSSMRGVVHHSDVKNSPPKNSECNEIVKLDKSESLQSTNENLSFSSNEGNKSEMSNVLNNLNKYDGQSNNLLEISNENINRNEDYISENVVEDKIEIDFSNLGCDKSKKVEDENNEVSEQCDLKLLEHKNNLPTTILTTNVNYKEQESDPIKILKSTQSKPLKQNNNSSILNTLIKPYGRPISYRDKVKMNLKKLSTCQHIPFVFGFSSPLNLIKSNNLNIEKIKESFDVLKEEAKPKLDESKLLKVDRPKVVICPQIQKKSNVANIIPPKIDMETDNKVLDRSFSWEDSDESNSNQSTVSSEHLSDEAESDQIDYSLTENDSLNTCGKNQPKTNEIFSNDVEVKNYQSQLHTSGMTDLNISSSSEYNEQEQIIEIDSIVEKEKITTSLNFGDLSKYEQHFESNANTMELKNGGISDKTVCPVEKNSNSVYLQSSVIIEDVSKTDNELITQWKSDWNELNKSVIEINKSTNYSLDETMNFKLKKKSRWDEQPNEKMDSLESFMYEDESMDKMSNYTYDRTKSTSSMSNDFLEEQNLTCETTSIKSGNDGLEYNNCSESLPKDYYDDYSQSYEQYSCIPLYSDMKSIESSELSPVDYSLYENYNPNYEYCDKDYEMWKSIDSSQQLTSIPTTSDTLPSSLQIENNLEISHSDIISNEQTEFSKDEAEFTNEEIQFSIDQTINNNIVTIIPDVQDEVVENEKPVSTIRDEQFVQLYQQHFQHYNQNPVKYSVSDPILDSITDVDFSDPEKLPEEELSDTEQKIDKSIPIPLQERAYACIIKDDNTNLYLTSDNYIAYCAVEDRCMVHIAVDSTDHDGIEDKVRHCFNINQNGTTIEYWLHADLIPFHTPSDAESGVFSDDEVDSLGSDSGQEEHVTVNDNNEVDDNEDDNNDGNENADMIVGEWEMIDSDSESNVDSWLDNPSIIGKYAENSIAVVGRTLPDLNQEEYASNSSDYDSDISENSESNTESYSNEKPNITINQLHNLSKEDENKSSNIIDEMVTNNVLEQTENTVKNVDIHEENDSKVILSDQLVLDVGKEKKNTMFEDNKDSTLDETLIKNDDSVLLKSEKKESEILAKREVATEDILMMDTIINQQLLIQRLKIRAKEKVQEKLPDTVMVHYSDNMETIKYPFLGLFQPPTISILSKKQSYKSNLSKRVTFADGILPGEDLAASPTHDDVGRPLSPPPLKALMREILKFKRNMYPFKKSKMRTKLTMVNKKVATVTPSIKATTSSVIEYYVSQRRLEDLPIAETTVFRSNNSPNSDNDDHTSVKISTPPRPARELTPVPSDNECWDDDDNVKNDR